MNKKFLIKTIIISILALSFSQAFAQSKQNKVKVELANVTSEDGKLFVSVYNSEKCFNKKDPCYTTIIIPSKNKTEFEVELPDGDYLFAIFHDINNNGKLDEGMFGMPKEPVAMNNYNGKSIPKFSKLKVSISNNSVLPMELFSF